jgi:hypothetical protein
MQKETPPSEHAIKPLRSIITKEDAHAAIQALFAKVRWTRDRQYMEDIQAIVDKIGEKYEIMIPQPDGIPKRIQFVPRTAGVVTSK